MATMNVSNGADKPPPTSELWLRNVTFRRVYDAMVTQVNPNKDGRIPPGGIAMAAAGVSDELDDLAMAFDRIRQEKAEAEAEVARLKRKLKAEKRVVAQLQADLNRGAA